MNLEEMKEYMLACKRLPLNPACSNLRTPKYVRILSITELEPHIAIVVAVSDYLGCFYVDWEGNFLDKGGSMFRIPLFLPEKTEDYQEL